VVSNLKDKTVIFRFWGVEDISDCVHALIIADGSENGKVFG